VFQECAQGVNAALITRSFDRQREAGHVAELLAVVGAMHSQREQYKASIELQKMIGHSPLKRPQWGGDGERVGLSFSGGCFISKVTSSRRGRREIGGPYGVEPKPLGSCRDPWRYRTGP
jgi:hypothetical protein